MDPEQHSARVKLEGLRFGARRKYVVVLCYGLGLRVSYAGVLCQGLGLRVSYVRILRWA